MICSDLDRLLDSPRTEREDAHLATCQECRRHGHDVVQPGMLAEGAEVLALLDNIGVTHERWPQTRAAVERLARAARIDQQRAERLRADLEAVIGQRDEAVELRRMAGEELARVVAERDSLRRLLDRANAGLNEVTARMHAALKTAEERALHAELGLAAVASGVDPGTIHRDCCGTEHDPERGKIHGCCVICGVPWPCSEAPMVEAGLRRDLDAMTAERDAVQTRLDEMAHNYAISIDAMRSAARSEAARARETAELFEARCRLAHSALVAVGHDYQRESHARGCEACRGLVVAINAAAPSPGTEQGGAE